MNKEIIKKKIPDSVIFFILVQRVIEFRRVCCELLSKGTEWVATRRTTARGFVPGLGDSRGEAWRG